MAWLPETNETSYMLQSHDCKMHGMFGWCIEKFCKDAEHRVPGCSAPTETKVVEHDENAEDDEASDPPLQEPQNLRAHPNSMDHACSKEKLIRMLLFAMTMTYVGYAK